MIKSAIVLPDIHFPYQDNKSLRAVEKYIGEQKDLSYLILLGDLVDLSCISDHNIGNLRAIENKKIFNEYTLAENFLANLRKICGESCKIYLLQGNHEYRAERYINKHPQLRGLIEPEICLKLKEKGITWVKSWEKGTVLKIGKACFIHGLYTTDSHAKKHVENYGENIFYGHSHNFACYSKTTKGDNKTRVGQSLGCLCRYDLSYLHGHPNKWQQGFAKFYFRDNGFFNYYPVMIFNGSFVSPEGKVYTG